MNNEVVDVLVDEIKRHWDIVVFNHPDPDRVVVHVGNDLRWAIVTFTDGLIRVSTSPSRVVSVCYDGSDKLIDCINLIMDKCHDL